MTVCYHLFNWPEGTGRASAAAGASFPPLTSAQDLLASSSQRLEPIPRTPPCKVQSSSSSSPTSLQWVRVTLMLQRQELGSQILEATARHFFTISPWDTRSKVRTLESCLFGEKKNVLSTWRLRIGQLWTCALEVELGSNVPSATQSL